MLSPEEIMASNTAVSRRELFRRLGVAGAAAFAMPGFDRVLAFQRGAVKAIDPAGGLNPAEARTLAAVCARIIPSDASGPGAAEAKAAEYIDRALAGWLAPSREAYTSGLATIDDAARASRGNRFVDLVPADQDAVLAALDQTPFFTLVRAHTIQGTFCDPAYGGNANFVGWDLIGYPGVRLNVTAADQRMGTAVQPVRRSAYEYAMFANTMGAMHAH
jgi:gluconate 2-dehydrogenase gamma chain